MTPSTRRNAPTASATATPAPATNAIRPQKTPDTFVNRMAASRTSPARRNRSASPARRTEHLQRGHPLEAVDELRREGTIALRPEAHVRAERPVLDRRDRDEHAGEGGDDADDGVDDPDDDDDRDLRRSTAMTFERNSRKQASSRSTPSTRTASSSPLRSSATQPGPRRRILVDEAPAEVGGDADGGARHQPLLDRGGDGAEPDEGDGEAEQREHVADGPAIENAADRERDGDARRDACSGDDQAEAHEPASVRASVIASQASRRSNARVVAGRVAVLTGLPSACRDGTAR